MALLEKHKDLKIEHKIQAEKKQEFKIIGSQKNRPGQHMYGLNTETLEVYKIEILKKDIIDINGKNASTLKAVINPKHPIIWAINFKNALRKFEKYSGLSLKKA